MSSELPYLLTNKRLPDLFSKIQTAAVPEKFTFEFLKKLGFTSSNDRGLPSLLKKLGFLDQNGSPTPRYNSYRHKKDGPRILAESIRELYVELFAIDENVHKAKRDDIIGIVSRVTGQEDKYVRLISSTFSALCNLADFNAVPTEQESEFPETTNETSERTMLDTDETLPKKGHTISFRHNIEIHLPATTNIAIYNAIFKSLKDHLLD